MWRVPALPHGWRKPRCGTKQHYLGPRPIRELPLAGIRPRGRAATDGVVGNEEKKQERATKVTLQARGPP